MNMDQIRARLSKLNQKTGKRRDLWKPKDKHVVRLLPYPHGDEPFIELGFHYDIGDTKSVLCPKHNEGKECAICNFAELMRSWNDPDGVEKPEAVRKADFEVFKKIQVKERWYVPMIERGQEAQGPKFWAFSKSIYEKLLKVCLNEENNDIVEGEGGTGVLVDPTSAFDLTVDFYQSNNKDGKGNNKSFPLTDIEEKKRPSKLAKSSKEVTELLDKIVPITEVYQPVSSEEVERIFNAWVNSGAAEPDVIDVGTEYTANTAETPVQGGQSIDEAFGEMTAD